MWMGLDSDQISLLDFGHSVSRSLCLLQQSIAKKRREERNRKERRVERRREKLSTTLSTIGCLTIGAHSSDT